MWRKERRRSYRERLVTPGEGQHLLLAAPLMLAWTERVTLARPLERHAGIPEASEKPFAGTLPEGIYVAPREVPQVGNVRVLLGTYGGERNPIPISPPIVYLHVVLAPLGHAVAWVNAYRGPARASGESLAGKLAVLEEGDLPVMFEADTDVRMFVGCAAKPDGSPRSSSSAVRGVVAVCAGPVARPRRTARLWLGGRSPLAGIDPCHGALLQHHRSLRSCAPLPAASHVAPAGPLALH